MRIIHATNSLTRTGGGTPYAVWGLAGVQQKAGHAVSVWGLSDPFDPQDWPPGRDPGMNVRSFDRNGPFSAGWSRRLHAALLDPTVGGNVDVLHQHGIWSMLSHSVHQWRRRWMRPSVIAVHGMLDEPRLEHSRWKKRLFGLLCENNNLRAASCLHALCPAEASSMRNFGLKAPIAVIPNGISLEAYQDLPDPAHFAHRFPRCKDRPIVLYLGRITPLKGIAHLVDAWKRLERRRGDGWLLVVAGPNQLGFEDEMKQKVAALEMQDNVLFPGPLYGEAKREALSAASLFVLPSFTEGFAISLLEAMACRLPLVITRQCNFDEVEAEGAGWVGEPNVESMTDLLDLALSQSEDRRVAVGQRGYDLVQRKYTWPHIAQEMLLVYQWLLGASSAPPRLLAA